MLSIALQTPLPVATHRSEKPAVAADLPPVATVAALPDSAAHALLAERPFLRDKPRENFTFRESGAQDPQAGSAPEPFPDLRFADPLPNLPELDLPAKTTAYQAALSVLRSDDLA